MFQRAMSCMLIAAFFFSVNSPGVSGKKDWEYELADDIMESVQYIAFEEPSDGGGYLRTKVVDSRGVEVEKSANSSLMVLAETYPEAYDLRDYGFSTVSKHQEFSAYCWAFAAMASAESSVLKQGLPIKDEWLSEIYGSAELAFSPVHLGAFAYEEAVDVDGIEGDHMATGYYGSLMGGNASVAAAALATGMGVQLYKDTPFEFSAYGLEDEQRFVSYYRLKNMKKISMNYKDVYSDKNAAKVAMVKKGIYDYGACTVAYYPGDLYVDENNVSSCYQNDMEGQASHASVIVGWDDNFNSFDPRNMPQKSGAWLIKDTYKNQRGDDGYFWLSYYDNSIVEIGFFEMMPGNAYEHIYQYDGTVCNSMVTCEKAANLFTAKRDETLNMLSVMISSSCVDYTVAVYKNPTDDNPESGELCTVQSGSFETPGYMSIELAQQVSLSLGDKFSVVFTITEDGEPSEIQVERSGFDYYAGTAVSYGSRTEQSYIYDIDKVSQTKKWMDTKKIKGGFGNIAIKAMTVSSEDASDKSALSAAIADASARYGENPLEKPGEEAEFVWEVFVDNLNRAKDVFADDSAEQYEIDNAQRNINALLAMLEKDTVYEIYTAEDLHRFSEGFNKYVVGSIQKVVLKNDITMGEPFMEDTDNDGLYDSIAEGADTEGFTAIGTWEHPFTGVFDGQKHTISNLFISGDEFQGLIANLTGTVKNLTIKDSCIIGTSYIGAVAGVVGYGGELSECFGENIVVVGADTYSRCTGGLAGSVTSLFFDIEDIPKNSRVENCAVASSYISGVDAVGGVLGYVSEETEFAGDLSFSGKIEAFVGSESKNNAGTIIGGKKDESMAPYYSIKTNRSDVNIFTCIEADENGAAGYFTDEQLPVGYTIESVLGVDGEMLQTDEEDGVTKYFYTISDWDEHKVFNVKMSNASYSVIEYDDYIVTVVPNDDVEFIDAQLFVGVYDEDGSLVDVAMKTVSITKEQSFDFIRDITVPENSYVKVMLWSGITRAMPLGKAQEYRKKN
ncbi:MAG: lectin like domain-containing protein [Clostridia bacterium]|nr:lectin like domain-containing protein [Clostridia bacterium]